VYGGADTAMANFSNPESPFTPASVFHVASISKAIHCHEAFLLLATAWPALAGTTRRRKYITELPDYGAPLTIRHLLTPYRADYATAFLLQGMACTPRR